jgi:hypothetical protein
MCFKVKWIVNVACNTNIGWSQCHKGVKMNLIPITVHTISWVSKDPWKKKMINHCYWLVNHNDWPTCDIYIVP